jgi:hypothetical protein
MPGNVEYLQDWCRRNQFPAPLSLSAAAAPYPPSIEPLALLLTDLERAYLDLKAAVKTACESLEVPERRPSIETIRDTNDAARVAIDDAFAEHEWLQRRILRDIARLTKGE